MDESDAGWSLPDLSRVNVVGTSGSGKSTFCKRLSGLLGAPHIEMDRLYHKPNWGEPTAEEFAAIVAAAIKPDRWVLDGNYHSKSWKTKWSRATAIVWLDMSFTRNFTQAFGRAIERIRTGKELWPGTGNRETFSRTFFSRESVLLWMIMSHGRVGKRYAALQQERGEFNHVPFVRLRGRKASEEFLKRVGAEQQQLPAASTNSRSSLAS